MSGHTEPSQNPINSASLSTKAPQLSSKNSASINSRPSSVSPLSSLDNRAPQSATNIISTPQILSTNINQIVLSESNGGESNIFNNDGGGSAASISNRSIGLNDRILGRAIDFSSSDKESPIGDSWKLTRVNKVSTILRDCSDNSSPYGDGVYPKMSELKASDSDISSILNDHRRIVRGSSQNAIKVVDTNIKPLKFVHRSHTPSLQSNQSSIASQSKFSEAIIAPSSGHNQASESQAQFGSLIPSGFDLANADNPELRTNFGGNLGTQNRAQPNLYHCDSSVVGDKSRRDEKEIYQTRQESQVLLAESPDNDSNYEDDINLDDDEDEFDRSVIDEQQFDKRRHHEQTPRHANDYMNNRSQSPSYFKRLQRSFSRRLFVFNGLNTSLVSRILTDSSELDLRGGSSSSEHPYTKYEDKDLLTGTSKYKRTRKLSGSRTFRGSYKYSRAKISMAIFKKLFSLLVQRSTLALFGAFLIHVTLGTVYTLSNINSYLTSYMRKHGSPNATYGGSMWISSLYAVGQGFSMVLGGYIEKRFSARVACLIGCFLHSLSIMSTSWSVDHGPLAVLVTYGFIPGFGCGLAYMTPMSNGFGWFPSRKGLVAGVILAGFGIGTFIFNMAQTAYVNPENLSPPEHSDGYFTQNSILDKVPQLFVFMGTIYAAMQFIGCCLLFKPPDTYTSSKGLDERPILVETEMPLKRSIQRREFIVLFLVYGITTQGVLFVNSMIKEYGQIFIGNDMYLAWTGSMASIANSMGRLTWGLAIDRFSFTQCFTSITVIFGSLMFIMPFEFVLSSKLLYLLCTLGIFGSFSGWMSTYPVHLSRVFGRTNSGMIYGLIFISQSLGGILTALGAHYLIDHYNRFVPFFCVVLLEIIGLAIYHLFYPK